LLGLDLVDFSGGTCSRIYPRRYGSVFGSIFGASRILSPSTLWQHFVGARSIHNFKSRIYPEGAWLYDVSSGFANDTADDSGLSQVMAKKLTAAERLVDEQMLAIIEWVSEHPTKWHPIGKLEATKKAAELLAKRDVIEMWPETNQYRLKPRLLQNEVGPACSWDAARKRYRDISYCEGRHDERCNRLFEGRHATDQMPIADARTEILKAIAVLRDRT
jgi:hypothetical protein